MKQQKFEDLILYEDENLIVLNKPAGLSSVAERDTTRSDLLSLLRAKVPGARLCHRLDRETSGVIVAARVFPAFRVLAEQFRRRQVHKVYHAVVWGKAGFEEKTIDLPLRTVPVTFKPIGHDARESVAGFRAVCDSRRGRPSQTIVTAISTSRRFSLVECRPITGRMHQIRAHLAKEGFPVVSDPLYRGAAPFLSEIKRGYRASGDEPERPLISRVALHAVSIQFELFGQAHAVEAPYPKDFTALLKILSRYDGLVIPSA
jgi:23S rRNA pseudouridine955/2504/2580 synthase